LAGESAQEAVTFTKAAFDIVPVERATMNKCVVKEFDYALAGFPVTVENVEVAVTGEGEFPLLDHETLTQRILLTLAAKPTRLTGNQVRYIRHSFGLSLRDFAKIFRFTGPSVHAWEQRKNHSTSMEWSSELFLRTEVLLRFANGDDAVNNRQRLKDTPLPHEAPDATLHVPACPAVHSADTIVPS